MIVYLRVENLNLIVSLAYFLQQLVAKVVESGIIALQLSPEISSLGVSTC